MRIKRVVFNYQTMKLQLWRSACPFMREIPMTINNHRIISEIINLDRSKWRVYQPKNTQITIYERA